MSVTRRESPVLWLPAPLDVDAAVRVGRSGSGELVVEFVGLGVARAIGAGAGTVVHFEPEAGVDPRELAKLEQGPLDTLRRQVGGRLTLHGAAVVQGERAVAVVGESRAGKSTLASRLVEDGATLVADDTLAVEFDESNASEAVSLTPTQNVLWLEKRSTTASIEAEKVPFEVPRVRREPVRLASVISLVFDPAEAEPKLTALSQLDSFAAIAHSVLRFVVDEPQAQLREFELVARVARGCPVFELRRPFGFDHLDRAADLVRSAAGAFR